MTESKQTKERARPGARVTARRLLKRITAQDSNNRNTQTRTAPLSFQSLPPAGKRYLVMWGAIVVFASLMIIISAGFTTFLGVLGVSVLFVIAVSAVVGRLL